MNIKIVEPLELLHVKLYGPSSIERIDSNTYILVIVEDFS